MINTKNNDLKMLRSNMRTIINKYIKETWMVRTIISFCQEKSLTDATINHECHIYLLMNAIHNH